MKLAPHRTYLNLRDTVSEASKPLNKYWPLKNFIACNALKGYESMDFDKAMLSASELFSAHGYLELSEYRAMYETGRINPVDLREAFGGIT